MKRNYIKYLIKHPYKILSLVILLTSIFIYGIKLSIHITVCMYKSFYSSKYIGENSKNSTTIEHNE